MAGVKDRPGEPTAAEAGSEAPEADAIEADAPEGGSETAEGGAGATGAEASSATTAAIEKAERADTATRSGRPRAELRDLTVEELLLLEEERDFLLRSLKDLDAERAAGDVDEHDYETLRDDYTARAARVIRAIERHQARREPAARSSLWRKVGVAAGVVAFALLAGVLVAQATGRRGAGDTATGDIRESSRQLIDEALQTASTGDFEGAVVLLDEVLEVAPDNVEALTYKGWFEYRSGAGGDAVDSLTAAVEADPSFPATHAFLAVILAENGRPDLALEELRRLDALDPPAQIRRLVEPLRQRLDAEASAEGDGGAATTAPGATTAPAAP